MTRLRISLLAGFGAFLIVLPQSALAQNGAGASRSPSLPMQHRVPVLKRISLEISHRSPETFKSRTAIAQSAFRFRAARYDRTDARGERGQKVARSAEQRSAERA
jgi:hypothetical protein